MQRRNQISYRRNIAVAILVMILNFSNAQTIGKDKYYHFGAGVFTEYTGQQLEFPIGTSFLVGFGKESFDYIQYGKFDTKDLLATTIGGVALTLTMKLINKSKDEKINNNIVRSFRKHKRKRSRKKR